MFGESTVTRPVVPTGIEEAGYYWLGAGVVAAALVGFVVGSRIGATIGAIAVMATTFYEFAFFGAVILTESESE